MHLAIVTPYPPRISGIGQYGYHVSQALARSRVFERITILTETASCAAPLEEIPRAKIEGIWRQDGLDAGWRIGDRLRVLDPDVVWYNLGVSVFGLSPLANLSGLLSLLLTRRLSIPSVATMHEAVEDADFEALGVPDGPITALGAKLVTQLMLQADVTCVTLSCHARALGARYPEQCLMHVPHGAFDSPEQLPESEQLELLHFGSQAPFKGLDLLLGVLPGLRAEWPELRLTVGGAEHPRFPGYVASLRRQFADDAAIRWEGVVPTSGLPDVFGRATIVVLPQTATTGSSSVLCRAATWGRPVVASDLAELRATARESGFRVAFFRAGDADGLGRAIRLLLDDAGLRAEQVEHNLKAVGSVKLEKTCQLYVRAFNRALASQNVASRIAPAAVLVEEAV
jgi:glycosyltransferase involved in cell wall biosynthesis